MTTSPLTKHLILGSDHRGVDLKEKLKDYLKDHGYTFTDIGSRKEDGKSNYADLAHEVAKRTNETHMGILLCKTGNGMGMAANKHTHVRAALCWNVETAHLARAHNDANILCLPSGLVKEDDMLAIVDAFLDTAFEEGRHTERVSHIPLPNQRTEA